VTGTTRRAFLSRATAAGFLLGFQLPRSSAGTSSAAGSFAPNAFIRIDSQGGVTLTIPQVEMGQGIYTSLSMILAEELDADWNSIRVEHAPADELAYRNPLLPIQMTGNSTSMRAFWLPLRQAGATARACLVEAAARRWQVAASECHTADGQVMHASSGRSLRYGALVGAAATIEPSTPPLKKSGDLRFIGHSMRRLDTPGKVDGTAKYGIDVRLPGMSFAMVMQTPVLGGTVARVDDTRARRMAGVRQVVVLENLVAVVGEHTWAAQQGLAALDISWNDGPNAAVSSALIWSRLRGASRRDGAVARNTGDVAALFGDTDAVHDVVSAEYELPLLAHACMEPMNCTVHVTPDSAEAWIGTQVMGRVRSAVAEGAKLPEAAVTIHNHLLGGGFGRRLEADMALNAARIAREVRGPVKVIWSREEDIRHDVFRPPYHNRLSALLRGGRIAGWKHQVTGSAVLARFLPAGFRDGVDLDGVESAHDMPYEFPSSRVEFNREEPPGVITGLWRGVGSNNAVFAIECFMDELARRAGADPIAFRRVHLDQAPRLQAALDLVKAKSGWGTPLPARHGRGVAAQTSFGSCLALVIECAVDTAGEVLMKRITAAVDVGFAVNPDTVVAQVQGGIVFGLSAALLGEITLSQGRVQQSNFHDYPVLRMGEVPPIDVHVIASGEAPGGIGESGTVAVTPALRNAIYAATGVALRRMPVDRRALAVS
jgi:isoquinoline 1-oxidoreductase beta subunit